MSSTSVSKDATVELRPVDDDNLYSVIKLSVADNQDDFVAPNVHSLAEAFVTSTAWVRAIYADDEPVGFMMLNDDDQRPRYYLWRFMIDQKFQGMGFGAQAMHLLHDYVRTRPNGDKIYLSYVPAEGGPEGFYKRLGYVDTGREEDGELEAVLDL